jgi:glycosyltransferase involved in cell wall biosynthesis
VTKRFDAVAVTKESDAARLGHRHTVLIPNGCSIPSTTPLHAPGEIFRLAFQGHLQYEPNRDAAHMLAREVLPAVRARCDRPVELRLIGKAPSDVEALGQLPGVVVTGYVDDITSELAKADIVVVPLRTGSGTRLKVLEAFAHRVPVVSSTIGCDGLDVVDGRDLLIRDSVDEIVDACARILEDGALRGRLVEHARALVEQRYDWRVVEAQAADIVRRTAGFSVPT